MSARILVIEDNPANLQLMSYLLTAFGHTALTAADGLEGLDTARRLVPDLIVCDIQLPSLDGYEVARRLKNDPSLGKIPIVAVTAFAMARDRDRARESRFDGYLTKPIDPKRFVAQLEYYLAHAEPGSTNPPTVSPNAPMGKPQQP